MFKAMKDWKLPPPVTVLRSEHFTTLRDVRTDQELHKLGVHLRSSDSGVPPADVSEDLTELICLHVPQACVK